MTHDDGALLELLGEVVGMLDIDEFRFGLIRALRQAVRSDYCSLNDVGPDSFVAISDPPMEPHWFEKFGELVDENPLYRRHLATGDGRAYRFSDVVTCEELEATRLFKEFYAPLGVNHQIAFTLPSGADRVLALALSRGEPDYSDEERDFVNRARPYLIQVYTNAIAYSENHRGSPERLQGALVAAGLTRREAETVRLVALGSSNRDIAAGLGLSHRTVQKHLENAFRKLGVKSRHEAAARAWQLAASTELLER